MSITSKIRSAIVEMGFLPPESNTEKPSPTLADKLRESGARSTRTKDGFETFQTNEGSVIAGSPADLARMELMRTAKPTRWRPGGRDPAMVAFARANAHDKDLDIDWGDYAPDKLDQPDPFKESYTRADVDRAHQRIREACPGMPIDQNMDYGFTLVVLPKGLMGPEVTIFRPRRFGHETEIKTSPEQLEKLIAEWLRPTDTVTDTVT